MSTSNDRSAKAREAMAAASASDARAKRVKVVGIVAVVVIALAIVAAAFILKGSSSPSSSPAADASAPLPATVAPASAEYAYGVVPSSFDVSRPTVVAWEDFQCPGCGALERSDLGSELEKMAADGTINVVYRPVAFLDQNLRNDSSTRAMAAYGCALDEGVGVDFHNAVFDGQPAQEGAGFTDAQLTQFAQAAGLSGAKLDAFSSCMSSKRYAAWGANATAEFVKANIPGTPALFLDGTEIPSSAFASASTLRDYVTSNAKTGAPASSVAPSPSN